LPAPQARTLVVVRHAKAEAAAATDAGRPLSEVGLKQARETAAWLGEELGGTTPEDTTALVSSAVRTRQTWDEIAREVPATVRVLNGLYAAATAELLSTVQMVEPDVRTVVLVGHNPAVHELVAHLGGASAAGSSMPPSTAVVLDVSCAWHDLDTGCATVRSRHVRTA
jgi:phosphohistidine phosphatase